MQEKICSSPLVKISRARPRPLCPKVAEWTDEALIALLKADAALQVKDPSCHAFYSINKKLREEVEVETLRRMRR